MSERKQKQEMRDKVKQIILSKPKFNHKAQRIRIRKDMTDCTFDAPLNDLKSAGCLKWRREGQRVFYELTEKGRC